MSSVTSPRTALSLLMAFLLALSGVTLSQSVASAATA